eukprot:Opistho-2@67118
MHRRGHRRQAPRRWFRLGCLHPRRPQECGPGCRGLGHADGRVRRRRDPADQHGPRRHPERFRPGPDPRGQRRDQHPGDRLRRRRLARRSGRWRAEGRRRCGAGRQHLPLRSAHGRRGQGLDGRTGHSGPPMSEVRIIGGQWKRSKLPVANKPGLRPTPDRVRETLFNWLGQNLDGWRVLDAFAGSGALGFEAASRGADEVLLLER